MKTRIVTTTAMCMLAALSGAVAATWEQEPTAVIGIQLGVPLADQPSLPPCPRAPLLPGGTLLSPDHRHKGMCYPEPVFLGRLKVWNGPDLGVGYWIEAVIDKDLVAGVDLAVVGSDRARMLDVLIARYGQPMQTVEKTYRNRLGATFVGKEYAWAGERVVLLFAEIGEDPDRATFSARTKAYMDARQRPSPAAVKDRL
jgi:hypothetical protein